MNIKNSLLIIVCGVIGFSFAEVKAESVEEQIPLEKSLEGTISDYSHLNIGKESPKQNIDTFIEIKNSSNTLRLVNYPDSQKYIEKILNNRMEKDDLELETLKIKKEIYKIELETKKEKLKKEFELSKAKEVNVIESFQKDLMEESKNSIESKKVLVEEANKFLNSSNSNKEPEKQ